MVTVSGDDWGHLPANAGDIRDTSPIPGREGPLEEGMATHSSVLAWRVLRQRSLVGYGPRGCKERDTTEVANTHTGASQEDSCSIPRQICLEAHPLIFPQIPQPLTTVILC